MHSHTIEELQDADYGECYHCTIKQLRLSLKQAMDDAALERTLRVAAQEALIDMYEERKITPICHTHRY